ncbi:MAG: DUF4097 domain-containing protein [Acidobacteriia bacterium]|nr:DUF4097 domain-containing protein [Terriglobia bacterium]
MLVIILVVCTQPASAQSGNEFHRTIEVSVADTVDLDVELSEGDLQIVYGRDGQMSITTIAQHPVGSTEGDECPVAAPAITQDGNHVKIRQSSGATCPQQRNRVLYRIDVPYRTELRSVLGIGKQTIMGIMGPVEALTNKGDIKVAYISKGVAVKAASGDLYLEMIGERVDARTGSGNISCLRAAQGASVETGDGDIVLMVVGPSAATVKKGNGRIEVGGARGTFSGSTDGGDLHIKALPHDDWVLKSATGNIHVELPPAAGFEVDATTTSGELAIKRDDIARSDSAVRHFHQKVNGGGKQIEVRTESGKIVIG